MRVATSPRAARRGRARASRASAAEQASRATTHTQPAVSTPATPSSWRQVGGSRLSARSARQRPMKISASLRAGASGPVSGSSSGSTASVSAGGDAFFRMTSLSAALGRSNSVAGSRASPGAASSSFASGA